MRKTLLVLAFSALSLRPQSGSSGAVRKAPAPPTSAASGQEMYRAYCASCHGLDAQGGGPASSALKVPPPDLTRLAKRNSGRFPELRVFNSIAGDARVPAHGTKDMPVWGSLFLQ